MNAAHWFAGCVVVALLAGCASGPAPPQWQANLQSATERATEAYLTGKTKVEVAEFARARSEVARTGQVDLIARVELLRCATRVASLVSEPCEAFDRIAADVSSMERSYALYLAGQLKPQDSAQLPAAHQQVFANGAAAVKAMENPLSRLVAAGVLFKMGLADPALIQTATETASAQGWNRPLLAWLLVQRKRAEAAGDLTEAARLQRRMDLILAP